MPRHPALLPLMLNAAAAPIAVLGEGAQAARRVRFCEAAGAARLTIYAPKPSKELSAKAPAARKVKKLLRRWPTDAQLKKARLVFIGDMDAKAAAVFARRARKAGALVNVEDMPALCDFYVPALVRRGELLLTVSTSGASPALARLVREWLARQFPASWAARLRRIAALRARARKEGAPPAQILARTQNLITEQGWLK